MSGFSFGGGVAKVADQQFPNIPSDSVSCLALNGTSNTRTSIVMAGSWDSSLNCYEVSYKQQPGVAELANVVHQGQVLHGGPVLSCDMDPVQNNAFSGSADGTVNMWNPTQGPAAVRTIGRHDQPVRCVKWMPELNLLASASWDRSLRLWDTRQPQPVATIVTNERIYAMDAAGKIVVLGTADQHMHVFPDITQHQNKFEYKSPLNYQTRCVSIFADRQGYAAGSIEGRVAIEYFNECHTKTLDNTPSTDKNKSSFVFKCHRHDTEVYSVNAIDFYHTNKFLTAGSDGCIVWWDKDKRSRLCAKDTYKKTVPIVAAKFTPDGASMFYAAAYDWSRGADYAPNCTQNMIHHHPVKPDEIATRK
jgi:mRNA export factor